MKKSSFQRGEHTPRDHYADVTAKIIAALDSGVPPWRCQWDKTKAGGPMMPQNATTGARYRGINTLILGGSMMAFANGDARWATYKQAAEQGWQVQAGSRGTTGYFYKRLEVDGGDGEDGRFIPMLRSFTLFHASQIDGIPSYMPPTIEEAPWREPEAAAIIADNSGAVIHIGGDRAFYSPSTDHIQLPPVFAFHSAASIASVKLHELGHWTGHPSRLKRDLKNKFGSHDYAREELRAEIATVMICSELGIGDCEFTNGAAYIADWASKLREDKKEIFRAASDAQRIADYLLAFHPDYAAKHQVAHDDAVPSARSQERAEIAEAA